jgi:hypothetical protein
MPEMEAENTHTHAPGCFFCQTAIPLLEKCWSEVSRDHFRNSRVEFLKGLRSLIDDRIAHLSREPQGKGTHVTVE